MSTHSVNGVEIVTESHPAPVTGAIWVASEKEYDLGRPIGWGIAEQDAIDDLLEQLNDE